MSGKGIVSAGDGLILETQLHLSMDRISVAFMQHIDARKEAVDALIAEQIGRIDLEELIRRKLQYQISSFVDREISQAIERAFRAVATPFLAELEEKVTAAVRIRSEDFTP